MINKIYNIKSSFNVRGKKNRNVHTLFFLEFCLKRMNKSKFSSQLTSWKTESPPFDPQMKTLLPWAWIESYFLLKIFPKEKDCKVISFF